MGIFAKYPYTDFNNLNLDWILQRMKEVEAELQRYLDNSVITFADPITWDITEQYTALTVVVDSDGTAYLSKQPVPAGVSIDNTNYWLPIFNYDDNINTLRSQIAYNARTNATTGQALDTGDLVFWNGLLYHVLTPMAAGTAFIEGTNIEAYTVDEKINNIDITGQIEPYIDDIRETIAYDAQADPYTSVPLVVGDLVYSNGQLYKVIADMPAGTAFIVGTNIELKTVSERIAEINTDLATEIADRIAADTSLQNQIDAVSVESVYVNPMNFGAVGDGFTDDTDAFYDAIATGRPLYIPERDFVISKPLFISNDVWCEGTLIGTPTLDFSGIDASTYGGYCLVYLTGTGQTADGIKIRNQNLGGYWNGTGNSSPSDWGGILVHGKNISVKRADVDVYLWAFLALSPDGGYVSVIDSNFKGGIGAQNEVYNKPTSKAYESMLFRNCTFTANLAFGCGTCKNTIVENCNFYTFADSTLSVVRCIRNDAAIGFYYNHPTFINCRIVDSRTTFVGNPVVYVSGYNATDPLAVGDIDVTFIHCHIETVNDYNDNRIQFDGASRGTFINCTLYARLGSYTNLIDDHVHITAINSRFVANSLTGTAIVFGQKMDFNARDCVFTDAGTDASTVGYIDVRTANIENCWFYRSYRAPLNCTNYCVMYTARSCYTDYSALASIGTTSYRFFGLYNEANGSPNDLDGGKYYPKATGAQVSRLYRPHIGDMFFDTAANAPKFYNGTSWVAF